MNPAQFMETIKSDADMLISISTHVDTVFNRFMQSMPELDTALMSLCKAVYVAGISQGMSDARKIYHQADIEDTDLKTTTQLIRETCAELKADNDRS